MKPNLITLLTDFGSKDHYVASMKGVILSINPKCSLVDITHQIKAHDIKEGAFMLANAYAYFPKGTIHLAVVDPGVGGPRKPILFVTSKFFFLGPDNGLFTLALKKEKLKYAVILTDRKSFLPEVSTTFHGRDIFAPIAGYLSLGVYPKEFGQEVVSWKTLNFRKPRLENGRLVGEIIHIDSFGNLISNMGENKFNLFIKRRVWTLHLGERVIHGLKKGYWEGKKDEPIALIGSSGFLEISIKEGNAQKVLKVKKGDKIQVKVGRGK